MVKESSMSMRKILNVNEQVVAAVTDGINDMLREQVAERVRDAVQPQLPPQNVFGAVSSRVKAPGGPVRGAKSVPADAVKDALIGRFKGQYFLEANGRKLCIQLKSTWVFELFARAVAADAGSATVPHRELMQALDDPPLTGELTRASDNEKKAIKNLNNGLEELGDPPDGRPWIGAEKGKGYFLNKSVNWTIKDARLKKELARTSPSVRAATARSAGEIERNTPSREHRL
jgi:hypothetical protein